MKTRHFSADRIYRIIELEHPYWKVQEGLLNAKIRFDVSFAAKQDPQGFVYFKSHYQPPFTVLSGPLKDKQLMGLPVCRLRAVRPRDLAKCHCPAWDFPHRPGSGDCSHA